MSWKLLQWQQIRQNEWSFQAGTKKKPCTNRKSLLQTSSNHVAPIKTLIECLDSTATSRPFTIPQKVGIQPLKSLQVTHISAMPLPSTSWHLWNWSRSAPAAARREEWDHNERQWDPKIPKTGTLSDLLYTSYIQLHPVITTAGHKGNPELGAMLHYPTLPERAASCGNLRLPSQVPPPPSNTKGRKQESKDRLI